MGRGARAAPSREVIMVQNVRPLGGQRYRETFGRSYEDFAVGDVYEHRPGRTITQADNTWFTLLTMNTHPLHFDEEYAKATEFGRCLVASPLTVAILVGMSVSDVSQKAIANLGWREIRLPAPVFVGDTLYAESEVLETRESNSRPEAGLVTVRTTGRKQDGTVVCTFERTILVAKRGHSVEDRIGY
jgi:acyl dehydratase